MILVKVMSFFFTHQVLFIETSIGAVSWENLSSVQNGARDDSKPSVEMFKPVGLFYMG